MSGYLWKFYLEDDLESFIQVLTEAGVGPRSVNHRPSLGGLGGQPTTLGSTVGSPGASHGTSPGPVQSLKSHSRPSLTAAATRHSFHDVSITKADLNRKDNKGLTLLHHVASSVAESALDYAVALIAHPLIDLYLQDAENGWTALHRAFYFGNITVARAIIERDSQDVIRQGGSGTSAHAGNLIRVKDKEGNGPYDILTETVLEESFLSPVQSFPTGTDSYLDGYETPEEDYVSGGPTVPHDLLGGSFSNPSPYHGPRTVYGDEFFTFGSNRNITLGLGNQDDRQYPERVTLRRPNHIYTKLYKNHLDRWASRSERHSTYSEKLQSQFSHSKDIPSMPTVVRAEPIIIQDAAMAKFSTAILTLDRVSNLYMCGHGLGGRLGTGKEKTEFNFVCIEDFGSTRKCISAIALGQDHTLAVTAYGEVFSWGMNNFGQLGHGMSKVSMNAEEPAQLLPKQIFGVLKKETVSGVAASRIHSVVHTGSSLYTFGKNEGQLGIVDAHARSLDIQSTPRRVAASRFSCRIREIVAIDRATICLLENSEVHVFANYGVVKLPFNLDAIPTEAPNYFTASNQPESSALHYSSKVDHWIVKVVAAGNTICALSSTGDVYAATVHQLADSNSASMTSTTNPKLIKAALSDASRIWIRKKEHMAAHDIAVDQDGSILLTTKTGSVWRRVSRATLPSRRAADVQHKRSKDYKFMRIPGLTRVMGVRSSGTGAYCAIRVDTEVTKKLPSLEDQTLWDDIFSLLPLKALIKDIDLESRDSKNRTSRISQVAFALQTSTDIESDLSNALNSIASSDTCKYDMTIGTTVSDVRIPVHSFVLSGRSRALREGLVSIQLREAWSTELFDIECTEAGTIAMTLHGLDFLTVCNLVLYAYTDQVVSFWNVGRNSPNAFRYRQLRTELLKLASKLDMKEFETGVRRGDSSLKRIMDLDFVMATADLNYISNGDVSVQLENGEMLLHSDLLVCRCPFFEGLFQGRAGGRWLSQRRLDGDAVEPIAVDMKHVESDVFRLVAVYLYADTGPELFDNIVMDNIDDFLDLVLGVLSVANELMLDRLSKSCQMVIGQHVNTRNVCQLLNSVAPCSVEDFKRSALKYICLNLEAMLTAHLLDELDEDLFRELDEMVRESQQSLLPFVRSGRMEAELHERHPDLIEALDRNRRAKVDSIYLRAKLNDHGSTTGLPFDVTDENEAPRSKGRSKDSAPSTANTTPALKALSPTMQPNDHDRRFSSTPNTTPMQDAGFLSIGSPASSLPSPSPATRTDSRRVSTTALPAQILDSRPAPPTTPIQPRSISSTSEKAGFAVNSPPWAASLLPSTTKLGIKEIIDQAASSRTSSISLGLASQSLSEDKTATSFSSRISQKERRRQHQQAAQQLQRGDSASAARLSSSVGSPWQTVGAKAKPVGSPSGPAASALSNSLKETQQQRTPSTPQLTMRQTVANVSAPSKEASSQAPSSPVPTPPRAKAQTQSHPQKQSVSSSSTSLASGPAAQNSAGFSIGASSKPIEIQSIRHQPRPGSDVSPTFYMHQSMADIFSQQQAEKNVVKENVAKRSLQEIQQEQEFQEWWDQESRKVMEEEAAVAAAAAAASATTKAPGTARGSVKPGSQKSKSRGGRRRPSGKEKEKSDSAAA